MSELTRCNHCSLEDIKRRAKLRKAQVTLKATNDKDLPGWIAVWCSDRKVPVSYFLELPTECAC